MELILFRHGEAVDDAPGLGDQGRWLTTKGRRSSRKVSAWLAKRAPKAPKTVWTSSLVRGVQTAEILAATLGLEEEVLALPELAPNGDPGEVLRRLRDFRGRGPLALVGHEPCLSLLARQLLGDVPWPGLKKSGVAQLRLSGGKTPDEPLRATFQYLLRPKGMEIVRTLEPIENEVSRAD